MEREYLRRQNSGPQRHPQLYGSGRRRRGGPPWIVWVLLALVLIVLATVVIVKLTTGGEAGLDEPPESASSSFFYSPPPESIPDPTPTPQPPAAQEPQAPQSEPQDLGSLMAADGFGYAYYHFDEEAANQYILAVDAAGRALSGTAALYSLIAPTSMDVLLPEEYLVQHNVNSSDQRKALDRYLIPSINAMNPEVKTVPLFEPLRAHCGEALYYGSDRTWTQLGGYYAYVEFCKTKGIEPAALDSFTKEEYEGFLGGLSTEAGEAYALEPDTVIAYLPGGKTSLRYYDEEGELAQWPVILNGEGYDSSLLYLIFAAGDHAYKELVNEDLPEGPVCVVVQDSFGNYFIPFLTRHYQRVVVVDCRYYEGSVKELAAEEGAEDVILLNSLFLTTDASAGERLAGLFG